MTYSEIDRHLKILESLVAEGLNAARVKYLEAHLPWINDAVETHKAYAELRAGRVHDEVMADITPFINRIASLWEVVAANITL